MICGTPSYVAPEILRRDGYSYRADLFSLGSVIFNILTGKLFGKQVKDPKNLTENTVYDWEALDRLTKINPKLIDFLKKLLTNSDQQRLDAISALKHPWFGNYQL